MPIDITMPALSPTMETGTLSKWLVKVGDAVKSGDVLAEIETDKATMEVESIDEGTVAELVVAAGTEGVPVGQVIMRLSAEGEAAAPAKPEPKAEAASTPLPTSREGLGAGPSASSDQPVPPSPDPSLKEGGEQSAQTPPPPARQAASPTPPAGGRGDAEAGGERTNASPLARRMAEAAGIDLSQVRGTGPGGRIVKADIEGFSAPLPLAGGATRAASGGGASAPAAPPAAATPPPPARQAASPAPPASGRGAESDIPHTAEKLSNVRKVIARRLTESKQTVPHFYLTNDVRLDALLKLRGELNAALEPRKIKLSVNDMVIKALALALRQCPRANVSFGGDTLISYTRADISVAVAAPSGLITPIIFGADLKPMSLIATEMKALAEKARDGKLQPHEYQGGTASVSNLGMYGIKQFDAVINPPQGMILAVGAGEPRPYVVDGALAIATVMTVTGSFDHRAIDGADGAELMKTFKALVEAPLGLVA